MTTATPPRRPSPANMPGAAEAARRLIEPGVLPPGRDFRPLFERGVTTTAMRPHPRLVALLLATRCDWTTGLIPRDRQPGLLALSEEAGLHLGQTVVALNVLVSRGWVAKTTNASYYKAVLQLHIPRPVLSRLLSS